MLAVWGTADIGLPQPEWLGATDRFPLTWTGGFDPLLSFPKVLESGPSGLNCQRIQRAGRATRRYLEHMGIDHGGGQCVTALISNTSWGCRATTTVVGIRCLVR